MSVNASLSSSGDFERQLAFGRIAETQIAKWIISRGNLVLPVYDVEIESGKGPRLFGGMDGELIAPDLLVMSSKGVYWIEAKHKSVFTWHRNSRRWVTGIDVRHYEHYLKVDESTPFHVWLLFLHQRAEPSPIDKPHGCPKRCPTGLFGRPLLELQSCENHRHNNWGPHGMVYWGHNSLTKLASLKEISEVAM